MTNTKSVIVSATKKSKDKFVEESKLWESISIIPPVLRPDLYVFDSNTGDNVKGLCTLYNTAIEKIIRMDTYDDIMFVHDDAYIRDWNVCQNIKNALEVYDIVGVAGSSNIRYGQCGWAHDIDENNPTKTTLYPELNFSGSVRHPNIKGDGCEVDAYGPIGECDLLDGVFLAVKTKTFIENDIRFDPQFDFHCYDIDFCYTAKSLGLTIGTWGISIDHYCGDKGYTESWFKNSMSLKEKLLKK